MPEEEMTDMASDISADVYKAQSKKKRK
jgi:hypothetical protein